VGPDSPVVVALENEALLAKARRDLDAVQSARRAVVERSDAARRSLQRDLHDGAQQRLIVLGLELSVLADKVGDEQRQDVEAAGHRTAEALLALRQVAQGALPQVLDDAGLGDALVSLAEQSVAPMELRCEEVADRRFGSHVERAAYRFVVSVTGGSHHRAAPSVVTATVTDGPLPELVLTVTSSASSQAEPTLEDLVVAAGGSVRTVPGEGRVVYEARFPCE
jgi:signal transduction histidine kinase